MPPGNTEGGREHTLGAIYVPPTHYNSFKIKNRDFFARDPESIGSQRVRHDSSD